jgi:hypothetical protein
MAAKLTTKELKSVPCPTCGAQPKETCKLVSGQARTVPHRDRRLAAADFLESLSGVSNAQNES